MTGDRVIFAGPSLPPTSRPAAPGLRYLPPARFGDVARAVSDGASAIGLIDGVFEAERAVWHREIVWALSRGVPILGAASMGALRALETEPFGMRGTGRVFEWYRTGLIEDDEEVAVVHAPAELDFRPLTEATVNVRASLLAAEQAGLCTPETASGCIATAKAIHYKDRSRRAVLDALARRPALAPLSAWLETHWIDQKARDAGALAALFASPAFQPTVDADGDAFQATVHWERFVRDPRSRLNLNGLSGTLE